MRDGSNLREVRSAQTPRRVSEGASKAAGGPAELGNAVEAMRVAATLLVVLYHAALAYVATPLRLTLWVAVEPSGQVGFDAFVYWVNGFVMPVFFLAAGVSAPAACESRGPKVFLVHRAKRLLRPLLFGALTILPAFYLLWGYGLMVTGRCQLDDILSWEFAPDVRQNLYGLGHLWFLEYLFVVCALWCAAWWLRTRVFGRAAGTGDPVWRPTEWLGSFWGPLLFAIPTAAIFLVDSDTMLRVDNVIVPNVARLLHYWLFFAVGGWISRVREPHRQFARYGLYYLGLSFVVFALMLPLLLRHASAPLGGGSRVVFCALAAVFPWLTVFGGLGVLLRIDPAKGPLMRSLSESAFWIYLIHVPIVALIQLVLLATAWPTPMKFATVAALGLGLSLASYGPCVRHSLIGAIVNGARKRAPRPARFGPELGWVAVAGVVLLAFAGAAWSARVYFFQHNFYAEAAGRLYRSARLTPGELEDLIDREGLKSVIVFTGSDRHPWFIGQQRVCRERRVELHAFPLPERTAPTRAALLGLVDVLERSHRPVLVQGYRGTDQVAFAAGVVRLLDGSTPAEALHQFDLKYGQFSGAEHSALGRVLLEYRDWLDSHHWPHTADRLQAWARDAYLGTVVPGPVTSPPVLARDSRGTRSR
jgi:glucans biosynthesis protein C